MIPLRLLTLFSVGVILLAAPRLCAAEEQKTGFLNRVSKDADGTEWKYVLFIPKDYDGKKACPLILFLHGAGETGEDGEKQVKVGLGPVVKKQADTFPFITIFPQAHKTPQGPPRGWAAESDNAKQALAILDEVEKEYKVDKKRVYLTGLSMGGYGTWSLAAAHPDKWAAIVPICGGGDPKTAEKFKDIPCWCFHGEADKVVPVQRSKDMIDALEAAGGKPKHDFFAGVGHDSWVKAYDTKELYEWLSKQERKEK
jgi:predicted peptidase